MILIKLIILVVCAGLNALAGYSWHNARRYIMPVIIAAAISYISHCLWLGLTVLPTIGILTIGYGEKSPLKHIFGDAWARFVWMALVCLGFSLGLVLTHHLAWWVSLIYVSIGGTIGITLRNIDQIIGDLLFGSFFATILFLIT